MPNTNYLSGRRAEYKLKREMETYGLIVLRTAGSHGPFDLIGIQPSLPIVVRFIQVKSIKGKGSVSAAINQFVRKPPLCGAPGVYVQEIWVRKGGKWFSKSI